MSLMSLLISLEYLLFSLTVLIIFILSCLADKERLKPGHFIWITAMSFWPLMNLVIGVAAFLNLAIIGVAGFLRPFRELSQD